jgi:hypothetical protein
MKPYRRLALCAFALVFGISCASTQATNRHVYEGKETIARPDRILVYDFGSTQGDIPPESSLAGRASEPSTPPTEEELAIGRRLGAEVATRLAENIAEMGLPGLRGADQPPPRPGDLVIRGYFLSIDDGNMAKRVLIGFGSGAAELKTFVEGYLMTEYGLRRLGSGEVDSGARGGAPGAAVPIAVTIATANPIGLIIGGTVKAATELSGTQKIQASGKRTADLIAAELRPKFAERGWIPAED